MKANKESALGTEEFKFFRPLEAPVFNPTEEEFQDPLGYLSKIRPVAEKAGICKIRPPANWQPPFAVDVDNFKFTPRIQRLNELEAKTRIKLNFLDKIAKFWELQGSSLKIPIIDKKALDLYSLHEWVKKDGGREAVTSEKKWNLIASRMGFKVGEGKINYGSVLRTHYEKFLAPYDVFEESKDKLIREAAAAGAAAGITTPKNSPRKPSPSRANTPKSGNGNGGGGGRMSGRAKSAEDEVRSEIKEDVLYYEPKTSNQLNTPNELKRLAFYGAGPKMAGFNSKSSQNLQLRMSQVQDAKSKRKFSTNDPLAKYMCRICSRGDSEDCMLLCDGCDDSYHTFCLQPPLADVPKGEWRCPKCVADEVSKPSEAFGFEQAQREYTLQQFGEMADQFKSEYFNMPVHKVSSEHVEKEFWRIVSAIDEDVTVEYGADLHTMDHGSGFPTESTETKWSCADAKYTKSGWNLNNLPVLPGSVLAHISTDISGMMVPWMYVGMCFSTFCWHNEDHWSYSINYLHWGEPKTWYGVPGSRADDFEDAMKQAAPELFQSQPDLLHQLVTIMNPNILMGAGVPVYRMDQKAGEFIITFPRAYHAGFNQGYNFAEAVNFAPADWISIGRNCIEHYSTLHRFCVFSHDELVCKMTTNADDLDLMIAIATYKDMLKMFECERELRRVVLSWGVTESERIAFEVLPDDSKLCEHCKTTCFLSALTCPCCPDKLVCLKHYDKLCDCAPARHKLQFRYTLDEIPEMMQKLKIRTEEYEAWNKSITQGVTHMSEDKLELDELNELIQEAETKHYPMTPVLEAAMKVKIRAEKCAQVAQKLANPSVRTRHRITDESKFKVTLEELDLFAEEVDNLTVIIKEAAPIRMLLEKIKQFKERAKELLAEETPKIDDLKACLALGMGIDIELPEIPILQQLLERRKWLEHVENSTDEEDSIIWTVDFLEKTIESGEKLLKDSSVEVHLVRLRNLRNSLKTWEDRAEELIHSKTKVTVDQIEEIYKEAKGIRIHLPSLPAVRDLLRKSTEWLNKAKSFTKQDIVIYLDELEQLIYKGENLPVVLKEINELRAHVEQAILFKRKLGKTFLKKNSLVVPVEAFVPRTEISQIPSRGKKKSYRPELTLSKTQYASLAGLNISDLKDGSTLIQALLKKEKDEIKMMLNVRETNIEKRLTDNGSERYCVCQSTWDSGLFIQCQLCLEHFHVTCVPLPKYRKAPIKEGISSLALTVYEIMARRTRFLCPGCARTRRPSIDCLVELLTILQNVIVRIPEAECIDFLANRAMRWVDKARDFLNSDLISNLLPLLEPIGVIQARDLPHRLQVSHRKYGFGTYVAVWPEQSGASITERKVDSSMIIWGEPGIKLWEEQLLRTYEKPALDIRNCVRDPSCQDFRGHPRDLPPIDILIPNTTKQESECQKITTTSSTNNTAPTISKSEAADALLTLFSDVPEPKSTIKVEPVIKIKSEKISLHSSSPSCSSYISQHQGYGICFEGNYKPSTAMKGYLDDQDILHGPVISLSKDLERKVDHLLMLADLMEVSCSEVQKIYKIREFSRPPHRLPDIHFVQNTVDAEIAFKDLPPKIRKEEKNGETHSPNKRSASLKRKGEPENGGDDGDEDGDGSQGPPSKKRQSNSKRNQEYNEDCAALKCRQPAGKEVNWVQCEYGCEQWFHWICVGLKAEDVKKIGRYCCRGCALKRHKLQDEQSNNSGISNNKENKEESNKNQPTPPTLVITQDKS